MHNKEISKERLTAIIAKKEKEMNDLIVGLDSSKKRASSLGLPIETKKTEDHIAKLSAEINSLKNRLATA